MMELLLHCCLVVQVYLAELKKLEVACSKWVRKNRSLLLMRRQQLTVSSEVLILVRLVSGVHNRRYLQD